MKKLLFLLLVGTVHAEPEQMQMQQQIFEPAPPVQEQLEIELSEKCLERLDYYQKQVDEHSWDTYYRYMLRKWKRRCFPE